MTTKRHDTRLDTLESGVRAVLAQEPNEYAEWLGARYGINPAEIMAEAERLAAIAGPNPTAESVARTLAAETGQSVDEILQETAVMLEEMPAEFRAK